MGSVTPSAAVFPDRVCPPKCCAPTRCDKTRTRTFLIPLTEPEGAGLYFWEKDGTRHDVDYKVGNVYSFEVSVLHAIRPFPYWGGLWGGIGMMDARVTIQAFAIPCWGEGDPGPTWYITH